VVEACAEEKHPEPLGLLLLLGLRRGNRSWGRLLLEGLLIFPASCD